MKKILWVHNFNPKIMNSGVFMHQLRENLEFSGVKIDEYFLTNLRNPIHVIRHIFKIRKFSKEFDIIHSQFGSMCGLICSFALCEKILFLRGSDWYSKYEGPFISVLHSKLQVFLTRISIKKYDKYICVSKAMCREVKDRIAVQPYYLPSPVDLKKFYSIDPVVCKEKLSLEKESHYILFPSLKLENAIKRFWFVEKVVEYIQHDLKRPDIKLLLAVKVPHSELKYYYNAASVIVLPSQYEGWPNVIKESLLCDTPFVTTDISDLKEIALKTNSCFVSNLDVQQFANCILKSINSNDENLRKHVLGMSMDNGISLLKKVYGI